MKKTLKKASFNNAATFTHTHTHTHTHTELEPQHNYQTLIMFARSVNLILLTLATTSLMSGLASGNSSEHHKPNSKIDERVVCVTATSLPSSILSKPWSTTSILSSDAIHCLILSSPTNISAVGFILVIISNNIIP